MTNNSDNIKLLIADDHAMTRKGIEIIAKYEWHIKDISSVSSLAETKNLIAIKTFSHLILDVSFGDGNSIEIIDHILNNDGIILDRDGTYDDICNNISYFFKTVEYIFSLFGDARSKTTTLYPIKIVEYEYKFGIISS